MYSKLQFVCLPIEIRMFPLINIAQKQILLFDCRECVWNAGILSIPNCYKNEKLDVFKVVFARFLLCVKIRISIQDSQIAY